MLNYLDFLVGWAYGWTSSGRIDPSVTVELGDPTREKRAAWLRVEGTKVAGQITVWETGECELGAYEVASGESVVLQTRQIWTPEELADAVRTVVAACE